MKTQSFVFAMALGLLQSCGEESKSLKKAASIQAAKQELRLKETTSGLIVWQPARLEHDIKGNSQVLPQFGVFDRIVNQTGQLEWREVRIDKSKAFKAPIFLGGPNSGLLFLVDMRSRGSMN